MPFYSAFLEELDTTDPYLLQLGVIICILDEIKAICVNEHVTLSDDVRVAIFEHLESLDVMDLGYMYNDDRGYDWIFQKWNLEPVGEESE